MTTTEMDKGLLTPGSAQYARSHEGSEGTSDRQHYPPRSKNELPAPDARGPRKLVLCFDGTGNKFHGDDSDSNILKIYRMLDRTADDQYHYYQPGIGTYVVSGSLSHTSVRARLSSWYSKAKDSAVGSSFDQHVVGGYRFLMRFYNPGDEIYMFGFSRGAYIARFLAEMLDYIGLLSHGNEEMVKFAWKAFSQWQCRQDSTGSDQDVAASNEEKRRMFTFMKGFRETFSRPVGRIKFLGLFDTVNSVPRFETAWMARSRSPYTARSTAKVIRHAVSIDERRAKFRQDLMYQGNPKMKNHRHRHMGYWLGLDERNAASNSAAHQTAASTDEKSTQQKKTSEKQRDKDVINGKQSRQSADRGRRLSSAGSHAASHAQSQAPSHPSQTKYRPPGEGSDFAPYRVRSRSRLRGQPQAQQALLSSDALSEISAVSPSEVDPDWDDDGQDIDEVWFAGGHGDVGGGWEMLQDRKSASHVPLAWIVREAMRAGLPFDPDKVAELHCSCSTDWDSGNPTRRRADAKEKEKQDRKAKRQQVKQQRREASAVPDIRVQNDGHEDTRPEYPDSPSLGAAFDGTTFGQLPPQGPSHDHKHKHDDDDDDASSSSSFSSDDEDEIEGVFGKLMLQAHTSRIHDSLRYESGLGFAAVTAWNVMEWMPFRRMDLKPDGSWEPISWPLPRGEVRDIPDNVRVHGSVIRRMKEDTNYRPGNLIVGGGGRGTRQAPESYGIGQWECVADKGDPIGEIWQRKPSTEEVSESK